MTRVIRRYNNRKLYDTCDSGYVSLTEIFDLVRGGEKVKVVNQDNDDITPNILLSAILERGKESDASQLSTEALISVIVAGDGTLSGFINTSLEKEN